MHLKRSMTSKSGVNRFLVCDIFKSLRSRTRKCVFRVKELRQDNVKKIIKRAESFDSQLNGYGATLRVNSFSTVY